MPQPESLPRRGVVIGRFAAVGVANTVIDIVLFMLLHDRIGIVGANFVSTSAGMTFSFVVNGLFTFRADRLTLRHAVLFLATTGLTMWLVQPLVIHGLLGLLERADVLDGDLLVLVVKVLAIGVSFVLNFAAYRWVVWPTVGATEPVSSDPRP